MYLKPCSDCNINWNYDTNCTYSFSFNGEEEVALLRRQRIRISNKKDAVRLAIQYFIECDISEPNSIYRKLDDRIKIKWTVIF